MYATTLAATGSAGERPRSRNLEPSVPYCFILDDEYKVIMAGPSGGEDPLADLYGAEDQPDVLPGPVDRVVRALTATWRVTRPKASASALVNNLQVTVAPLHGYDGRRLAVFIRSAEGRET